MKNPGEKSASVLVTGGAGYIGSVLVGLLLHKGYRVRVLDNLSHGGQALYSYFNFPDFEFSKGDLRNEKDITRAMEGIEIVIHLAAIVGDPLCQKYPELAFTVNKEGSERLCQIAIDKKVRRFVFASTCSNYGLMNDPDGFVDENSPLNPVSLYAQLKVGFEEYLFTLDQPDFYPACLRFATAYGLSPRPRFDLTVNEFTRELALNRQLEVYGEKFWRPYCHTVDLARACTAVIEANPVLVAGRAFNVGDNSENYQKKTIAEMIISELPDRVNDVKYVHRIGDPRNYRVNFDLIEKTLDFKITREVIDGIREIIFAIDSGVIKDPDDKFFRNR